MNFIYIYISILHIYIYLSVVCLSVYLSISIYRYIYTHITIHAFTQTLMNVLITLINVALLDDVKTQKGLIFVIVVVDMMLLLKITFNIVEVNNIIDN